MPQRVRASRVCSSQDHRYSAARRARRIGVGRGSRAWNYVRRGDVHRVANDGMTVKIGGAVAQDVEPATSGYEFEGRGRLWRRGPPVARRRCRNAVLRYGSAAYSRFGSFGSRCRRSYAHSPRRAACGTRTTTLRRRSPSVQGSPLDAAEPDSGVRERLSRPSAWGGLIL
jgi:hypothetical protein